MDRLPLVPKCEEDHDVLPILTEVLQDVFRASKYPINVAENYNKYTVDAEYSDLQTTGLTTIKVLDEARAVNDDITAIEEELMTNHARALIKKHQNLPFLEHLKLKNVLPVQDISQHINTYRLIQNTDICPNSIEQYLDFTYNPCLHTCEQPCPSEKTSKITTLPQIPTMPQKKKRHKQIKTKSEERPLFTTEPDKITFHNYQLGQTYKEKLKLRNITTKSQRFYCVDFPRDSHFSLKVLTESCVVAPGMYAEFLVVFQPQIYKDCTEVIKFKTFNEVDVSVRVSNSRDAPKLMCYVVSCLLPPGAVAKPTPGCKQFLEQRRSALNFTIDCGTCLLGTYALYTVIMKNEGQRGRFFIATEDEWCFTQLNADDSRPFGLTQGCFTIFPTLFEIDEGEVGQIFVLFVPEEEDFFTQKFYLICDNNSHQELEVMGDCIAFSYSLLAVHYTDFIGSESNFESDESISCCLREFFHRINNNQNSQLPAAPLIRGCPDFVTFKPPCCW